MIFPKEISCPHRFKPRKLRKRNTAPIWFRLHHYLLKFTRKKRGCWKRCPSYKYLALRLRVCVDSISRAFRFLEEYSGCVLAFVSGYTGPGRTREKLVCLKSWLKYDRLPLLRRGDGSPRGIRASFRRGVPLAAPAEAAAPEGNSDDPVQGNIEKKIAAADTAPAPPLKPLPAAAGMSKGALWRAAETAAGEAQSDQSLFWDSCRVQMPLRALKALFFEAFSRGVDLGRAKHLLRRSVEDAHAATVGGECGGKSIKNPGAFAAAVFRARLRGRSFIPSARPWRRAAPRAPEPPKPAPSPPRCIPAVPCRTAEELARVRQNALSLAAALREGLGGGAVPGRCPAAAGGLSLQESFSGENGMRRNPA